MNSAVVSGCREGGARARRLVRARRLESAAGRRRAAAPPAPPARPRPSISTRRSTSRCRCARGLRRVDDVAVSFDEAVARPGRRSRVDLGVSDFGSSAARRGAAFSRATGHVESVVCMVQKCTGGCQADVSLDVTGVHAGVLPRFLPTPGSPLPQADHLRLRRSCASRRGFRRSLTGSFELARCGSRPTSSGKQPSPPPSGALALAPRRGPRRRRPLGRGRRDADSPTARCARAASSSVRRRPAAPTGCGRGRAGPPGRGGEARRRTRRRRPVSSRSRSSPRLQLRFPTGGRRLRPRVALRFGCNFPLDPARKASRSSSRSRSTRPARR